MKFTMWNLPNLLTLTNLMAGCCAVLFFLSGDPNAAVGCMVVSFLCDTADGVVARAMKISSPLGKELDSLADVISFGLTPGVMLYILMSHGDASKYTIGIDTAALPAFLLTTFSAMRLAKFNIDTRQTSYFLGLSTPACTMFVLGLTLSVMQNTLGLGDFLAYNKWPLYVLTGVLSLLLVSEIPMFGLKIKRMDLQSNALLLAFVGIFAASFYFLNALALSITVIFYIIVSLFFRRKVTAPVA